MIASARALVGVALVGLALGVALVGLALGVGGCGGAGAPAAPFAVPAAASQGGRLPDDVRPLAYQLRLALDPAQPTFSGQVEIELDLRAPVAQLWLHAEALTIDRVTLEVDGSRLVPRRITAHGSLLGIELGRVVRAGPARLRLDYRGVTTGDEQGLFREQVEGRWYLFSQAEAQFARRITPCFDEPRHKVRWQVAVAAPAEATVLGNGAVRGDRPLGQGRHLVELEPTAPMSSYLLAIAVGPFRMVELGRVGRGGFPVRLAVPGGSARSVSVAAALVPRVVAAVESLLGLELPLRKLDLVAVPDFFGAMENPGLITINRDDLLGSDQPALDAEAAAVATSALTTSFARMFAHELAHQWFGNLVTPASWDDLWLSESLATWVANQPLPGLPELDDVLARISSRMAAKLTDLRAPAAVRRRAAAHVDELFDPISYDKGAAILTMLEHWLGAPRFLGALRRFVEDNRDRAVSSERLVAALQRAEPAAGPMLRRMLGRAGMPEVGVRLVCGPHPGLQVELDRDDGPLPICVRAPGPAGPASSCRVFEADGELPLPGGACPSWLVGNDDLRGYYRVRWKGQAPLASPPVALLTRGERLGLGWEQAIELRRGGATATAALAGLVARGAELADSVGARASATPPRGASVASADPSLEQDLADLELIAGLEALVDDADLASWTDLVARRASTMRGPLDAAIPSELERTRAVRMVEVLTEVPWPAAVTARAFTRAQRATGRSREAGLAWRLALRSGRPEVLAALLAAIAAPRPAAGEPEEDPLRDALCWLPASLMPALFAAIDRGALAWADAVPAIVASLHRRATGAVTITALRSRRAQLEKWLAPVQAQQLLVASGSLCARAQLAEVETTFAAMIGQMPDGEQVKTSALAAIDRCIRWRSVQGAGIHRVLLLGRALGPPRRAGAAGT